MTRGLKIGFPVELILERDLTALAVSPRTIAYESYKKAPKSPARKMGVLFHAEGITSENGYRWEVGMAGGCGVKNSELPIRDRDLYRLTELGII